jgi:hypothetical protein
LDLFVGNAGTAARFLAALCCLGRGAYRLSGVPRMHERPQAGLLAALRALGYRVDSPNDRLPAVLHGTGPRAARCVVSVAESSQFASALLMPSRLAGWEIGVTGAKRTTAAPDIPAFNEVVPGFSYQSWFGFVLPAGAARPVVMRLNSELNKILNNPETREKLRMRPVVVALILPEERAGIPTITEDRAKRVVAGLQHLGHIRGHDLRSLAEVRPPGHEKFAADFLPVEKQVGHAKCGPAQGGVTDRSGQGEGITEIRARRRPRWHDGGRRSIWRCREVWSGSA